MNLRLGMFQLMDFFDQSAKVSRHQGVDIRFAQALAIIADRTFAQMMERPAFRALPGDLRTEKQIDLPGKGTGIPPRALGHGVDAAMLQGPPAHNQTGLGESDNAQHQAL